MKKITLIVLGWIVLGFTAQAASFDCAKAATKVEKLICGDAALSKLDEELNGTYKTALQDEKQAEVIRQAQKQWMKERNGCADVACVKRAYEVRLSSLTVTHTSSDDSNATKQNVTPPTNQAKVEIPITPHVEEEACLAPKIDWRNYEWTLITGSGLPICEEMLAYVKSRPKDVSPPTCPEERLPSNGNWTRPESRILSEAEKQALLRDIPERWRQKPKGPVSYEQQIKSTKLLRVLRGDITRDGIPESLLAFGRNDDYRKTCETSKRCARPEAIFKNGIVLTSDSYNLLPMNDDGSQVNWLHRTVGSASTLTGGELIYYKGLPYWLSVVSWYQDSHDNFTSRGPRTDYPYNAIFILSEIWTGTGKQGDKNPNFKDVTVITMEYDPESNNVCRFGYFHRDNLKQNPPKTKR